MRNGKHGIPKDKEGKACWDEGQRMDDDVSLEPEALTPLSVVTQHSYRAPSNKLGLPQVLLRFPAASQFSLTPLTTADQCHA